MSTAWKNVLVVMAGTAVALVTAGNLHAQNDVNLRGLVDVVAQGEDDLRYLNRVNTRDSNFDAFRTRLFIEAARGNTEVYLQFLFSPESFDATRFYGGYLRHRPVDSRNVYLEAGLIPVHSGIWAANTYSDKNPLIAIPFAYFWKSSLPSRMMPTDLDQLLDARGRGQTGVVYADSTGLRGTPYATTPILYDNCWDYGAFSLGTLGHVEFAFGATVGAPAAPVGGADTNENIALQARLGYGLTPGIKVWASAARGAYLSRDVVPYLPPGKTINDYYQTLYGLSADWKWSHLWLMGEAFFNQMDTPLRTDGLSSNAFYLQGVYTMFVGWDLALRYDEMRYGKVQNSAGETLTWDQNVRRVESGVVYHVSRDLLLKGVVQANDLGDGFTQDYVVPAVQMSFSF